MSDMSFDIINNGKKITSIQANNFKEAMKEFAENYDMPDSTIGEETNDDIFHIVHGETDIEFRYAPMNSPMLEYTLGGINDFIKINKTGYKKV